MMRAPIASTTGMTWWTASRTVASMAGELPRSSRRAGPESLEGRCDRAPVLDHDQAGHGVVPRGTRRPPALALVEAPGTRLALGDEETQRRRAVLAGDRRRGLDERARESAAPTRRVHEEAAQVPQRRV